MTNCSKLLSVTELILCIKKNIWKIIRYIPINTLFVALFSTESKNVQ